VHSFRLNLSSRGLLHSFLRLDGLASFCDTPAALPRLNGTYGLHRLACGLGVGRDLPVAHGGVEPT